MASKNISISLLSDFNVHNLEVLLKKTARGYNLNCVSGPFGQTLSLLLDEKADLWSAPHDVLLLWTTPERVIPSFRKVLSFDDYSLDDLLTEVDSFAELLKHVPQSVGKILVPTWVVPSIERGWGPMDLTRTGVAGALMRMNVRLSDALEDNRRVLLLDSQRWITAAGSGAYSPNLWYLSKTPFHSKVFEEASSDLLAIIDGICGSAKKVMIVDLDNTVWGGIVGEVGWQKLRLGGHDPIGEAFVDFQKGLKRLMRRGVVLAIASKNEESRALEAISQHPEMILKIDDFVAWRIDWNDKAQNIVELLSELNLGLDSAVFLDDSPVERARVGGALPQVLVPEMPTSPLQFPAFLSGLRCFDQSCISFEDRSRTKMYVADRERTKLKNQIASVQEWLGELNLGIAVEPLNERNLDRAAQLFNKTNQMNLSTRRLSAPELFAWARAEGHTAWIFRVSDRFGDYGLCGISSLAQSGSTGQLVDFLLSCRVVGRGVEDAMLATVVRYARDLGCESVWAQYAPSPRNEPCRRWFEQRAGAESAASRFVFPTTGAVQVPQYINMDYCEADEEIYT